MDDFGFMDMGGARHFLEAQREMKNPGLRLCKVTNITDPDKLNRVLVKPLTSEDDKNIQESNWIPVVMPLSGKQCGVYLMPSVDDVVVVSYLDGDPNRPYVVGGTWSPKSPAPYTIEEGKNTHFSVKTPSGSELLFYDEKDKEYITLTTPKKAELRIDDEKKTASFQDPDKKNAMTLNWEKGELELKVDKKITITCGSSSVTIDGGGKIEIKADSEISLKAATVSIDASNEARVKGSSVNVEASGKLGLKGATADLKGSAGVNIN